MTQRRLPRRRNRRGAPDRFTRNRRRILYGALEARIPIRRTCELANIALSTYQRWLKKGEDPANRKYYLFRKKIKEIETRKEKEALKVIEKAQKGGNKYYEKKVMLGGKYGRITTTTVKTILPDWKAAAWWLERARDGYAIREEKEREKTPQEAAQEIREAMLMMDDSIPDLEGE